jgi:hypothetical protein
MATNESSMTNGIKAVEIESVSAALNDDQKGGDTRFFKKNWNHMNLMRYFSTHSKTNKSTKVGPKSKVNF